MTPLERALVNLSTLIVGISGAIYGVMKYLMTSDDPFSVVNHPLQPWALDLHVLAGPAMVFAIGLIARDHILGKMQSGANGATRRTGVMALSFMLPMVATGYLIQVFTHETARLVCVVVHIGAGTVYLAAFLAHLRVSRRIAARLRANGAAGRDGLPATAAWMRRPPEARRRAGSTRAGGRPGKTR